MFNKIRQKYQEAKISNNVSLPSLPPANEITKKHIYQNRYNHGVNFGSLFLLESYMYDLLFSSGGDNEYDAISAQIQNSSVDDVARKLAEHYQSFPTDQDWEWLKNEADITAIRIPIGYWHVENGAFVTDSMKFSDIKEVYEKAKPWDYFKTIVEKARSYEIGVLIDLHGLPGGANGDAHSGEGNGQGATFFRNEEYVKTVAKKILPFIVDGVCKENENIIGLQIVNEAGFNNSPTGEKRYYAMAVNNIRKLDPTLPIAISDGWWPEQWADWLKEVGLSNDVVIDSHVYRCFSEEDRGKSATQIIEELPNTINFPKDKADYVVGEFSCVLDEATWNKTDRNRDESVVDFGSTQTKLFQERASWGWFFWSLKFEHGDGGEWGFVPMVNKGAIPKRHQNKPTVGDDAIRDIINEHIGYWKDKGGENFEHWRFEDGIKTAVQDIISFSNFNNSRVGRTNFWKNARREQYIGEKGDSEYMWEWEQGYERALNEFNKY